MPLKLRPATEADVPALTDILHRAKASWGYPEEKMAEFREYWQISEATVRPFQGSLPRAKTPSLSTSCLLPRKPSARALAICC